MTAMYADASLRSDRDLLVAARDPGHPSRYIAVLTDRLLQSFATVTWSPGEMIGSDVTDLQTSLPGDLYSPSIAANRLICTDDRNRIHCILMTTGIHSEIGRSDGAVVLAANGDWVFEATDDGLHALPVNRSGPADTVTLGQPVRLLQKPFDNPNSVAILTDSRSDEIAIAIGCYGTIEFVTLKRSRNATEPPTLLGAQTNTVSGLPYDPIYTNTPSRVTQGIFGSNFYAVDENGTGVAAVEKKSGGISYFPWNDHAYGAIRSVKPSINSATCLVIERNGTLLHWQAECAPRKLHPVTGEVLLWQDDIALVLDPESGVVSETQLTASS